MSRARIPMVYLACPGHSGSTLVAFLLGAHSRIATVGELKIVPSGYRDGHACSCGVAMNACSFWARANEILARRGPTLADEEFDTHVATGAGPAERLFAGQVREPAVEAMRSAVCAVWPAARARRSATIRCNEALVRAILELTGRTLFLDTSKDASRLRYLEESGRFDLRVIHLIRDGRAAAWSLIRKGHDAEFSAREWCSEHEQGLRLRKRFVDAHWYTLKYEALCEAPDTELERVCAFLDVPFESEMLDFRSWDSHLLGNRMRLASDGGIQRDDSWRAALAGGDLRTVSNIVGPLNEKFGYV